MKKFQDKFSPIQNCEFTYSLLPIRCPPLSSSPRPRLSLRSGESFLFCVSPPCGAEEGGRTGAPFSLCCSTFTADGTIVLSLHLSLTVSARNSKGFPPVCLCRLLFSLLFLLWSIHCALSALWLFERTAGPAE